MIDTIAVKVAFYICRLLCGGVDSQGEPEYTEEADKTKFNSGLRNEKHSLESAEEEHGRDGDEGYGCNKDGERDEACVLRSDD